MAVVSQDILLAYDQLEKALTAKTQQQVKAALMQVDWTDIAHAREQIIAILDKFVGASAEVAGVIASEFYDEIAIAATGRPMGAHAYNSYNPNATEGAVRSMIQDVVEGKSKDKFYDKLLNRVDCDIHKSMTDCMIQNGNHDGRYPRFARVPTGIETCDFCLMLASRGAVYHSEDAAGALNHYHANCNCKVVQFYPYQDIEGYNPNELYNQWQSWIDDKAKERAEKNGTSIGLERSKIMNKYYNCAAKNGGGIKRTSSKGIQFSHEDNQKHFEQARQWRESLENVNSVDELVKLTASLETTLQNSEWWQKSEYRNDRIPRYALQDAMRRLNIKQADLKKQVQQLMS